MSQIKQILQNLKLSQKEVEVFLGLLKLGKGTAARISRESGITRTHIYDIVKDLISKGLVSEIEERGVKTYEAVDHAGLLAFVSREQKELQKMEKKIGQMASEFNALQVGAKQKTKVRFFDGVEGVKNIYEEIRQDLQKPQAPFEVLTIFSPANLERVIPDFQYLNYPNMIGRDIVAADEFLPAYLEQMKKNANSISYKIWPKEKGLFPTDNIAWKNKIAYIDLVGYPSGIIVENEAMVKTFTLWFEQMWGSLE